MVFKKVIITVKKYSMLMLFALTILGFFSFKAVETMVGSKKAVATLCIEMDKSILVQTDANVVLPENYTINTADDCNKGRKLCVVCVEDGDFTLDTNGIPDFPNNIDLRDYVVANRTNQGIHGSPLTIPGTSKTVTLYFWE